MALDRPSLARFAADRRARALVAIMLVAVALVVVSAIAVPRGGIGTASPVSSSKSMPPVPSTIPPPASPSPTPSSPAPVDDGPLPCATFDPACGSMPVDAAAASLTAPVACGSGSCQLQADILHPRSKSQGAGWPVVVAVPGGPGAPGIRRGLIDFGLQVAGQGAVVFVADYREGPMWGGGSPVSYEDIACALRFAREHAQEYGGDGSKITLVAHSFGTFVASVAALSPDPFNPQQGTCLATTGPTKPDAFIGISGVYGQDQVGADFLTSFFGGSKDTRPQEWSAGDPYQVINLKAAPKIPVRLVHGTADLNVPIASSERFEAALIANGWDAQLTTVPKGDHTGILQNRDTVRTVMETCLQLK